MRAIFLSILIHIVAIAGVKWALGFQGPSEPAAETFVDLGYETFDAPPEQAPPKPVIAEKAEELQDEKSEVAGTQEKKEEPGEGEQTRNTPQPDVPYYKIKPKYPKAALVAGTEGWVLLEIDITESGEVENIRVLDGEQKNMFQQEARRAVEQWKYRPFVDRDGKPYRKAGHQVRVDFKLTDET